MEVLDEASLQLKICTDEHDWTSFMGLWAAGFQDAPNFKRSNPDPEKRKKFLMEYIKYLYETEFSRGRTCLVCLKRAKKDGTEEILYAHCITCNKQRPTPGDISAMMKIDPEGTVERLRQDAWYEENIHEPMRRIAKTLNIEQAYGNFRVTSPSYQGMGLGMRYGMKAMEMGIEHGLRRGLVDPTKPIICYGKLHNMKVKKSALRNANIVQIAHLHELRLDAQAPVCADDSRFSGADFQCIIVTAVGFGYFPSSLMEKVAQMFQVSSSL